MTSKQKKGTVVSVPAEIFKIETRSKGMRITMDTNDLAPEEAALLMQYRDKQGWLAFAPRQIESEDLQDLPDIPEMSTDAPKSPAERLRGVLFVKWHSSAGLQKAYRTFQLYYDDQMNRIIERFKQDLPPRL
jgi:hypothetical protein